ncbi:DUF1835 domain-containing protein [Fictibacillus barbaricus]|uniref:DUF1835 domain-containing protein n=1 Tax=Fictibacillus barbaricus TaxID=182136 RepID=A0ABU1TWZ2_9BACL|nr:DUF1835 domain-containing protein [Fictibacillus barbaricus]MDR7071715.1 hypothetical protein [Fictibacillus barbaricus]
MNVHILFGESPAGCMKWMLKESRQEDVNRVIGFADLFSVGPLRDLENKAGVIKRAYWLNKLNLADEFFDKDYVVNFQQALQEIEEIAEDEIITIWTADNAHEQTGLRFVMKLLQHKNNEIRVINSNESFDLYCKEPDIFYDSLRTGEISPENMKIIMEKTKQDESLSEQMKQTLIDEWAELNQTNEILRIWEDHQIKSVESDYFDSFIVKMAKRIHGKRAGEFMKAARLIGTVIGHMTQYTGDAFIQHRLIHLIKKGTFEYKGTLNSMRNYSVRLVE